MENSKCKIRVATKNDVESLLEIYTYYVEKTAITFEYTVPTIQDFTNRIRYILTKYPYLIAEKNGEIVGYTYASAFHELAAYNWAVETSVYVRQDKKKMGIGKELYEALEKVLSAQNIINLNACIAYPRIEDEYLTQNSIQFHKHLGYRVVGEFYQCGYKFHRWYNMVWMEKHIGLHTENPPSVKLFDEIREKIAEEYKIL